MDERTTHVSVSDDAPLTDLRDITIGITVSFDSGYRFRYGRLASTLILEVGHEAF